MAAAGEALRELVRGPLRQARPVHAGPLARYLVADGPSDRPPRARTFALLAPGAVRVPIGASLGTGLPNTGLPNTGVRVEIGEGAISLDGARHPITRWWPTRPARHVEVSFTMFEQNLHARGEPGSIVLGLGSGLTPESDDELAGRLVALHALGRRAEALELARAVRAQLDARPNATTSVSAALLEAACDGHAIPQLREWLAHGCARDSPSWRALLAVGHTSGAALARGVESVVHPREAALA